MRRALPALALALSCADAPPAQRSASWWATGPAASLESLALSDTGGFDQSGAHRLTTWGRLENREDRVVGGQVGMREADPVANDTFCEISFEAYDAVAVDPCEGCLAAWRITRGPAVELVNVDGACAAHSWAEHAGLTVELGWTADTIFGREGGDWFELGPVRFDSGWVLYEAPLADDGGR